MQSPLHGIVPPLLTPLIDSSTLDVEGVHRLVEHVVSGGVAGVFLLGTCGEGPALPFSVRRDLILNTCQAVDRRVPVLVGVSSPSLAEALEVAEVAAEGGADGIVATGPYYFPIDDAMRVRWLLRLADKSPLPLIIYNMPSCVGYELTPDVIRQLADHPRIIGFKDSGGDLNAFRERLAVVKHRSDWSFMVGPEHLLAEAVSLGATGGINGGAVVCPQLYVRMHQAAASGDLAEVRRLDNFVQVLGRLYGSPRSVSSVIRGLKAGANRLGLIKRTTTDIVMPPDDTLLMIADRVIRELQSAGLLTPVNILS